MRPGSRRVWQAAIAVLLVAAAAPPAQAVPPAPGYDPHHPGIVHRTSYTPWASGAIAALGVPCPEGYRPFGGGVEVLGATNQVVVIRSEPVHTAVDNGFFAAAVERADLPGGDYPHYWRLRVTAACGPAYPNLTYVRAETLATSLATKHVLAVCPLGLTRVGMGGAVSTTSRAVRFDDLGFGIFSTPGADYPAVPHSARALASELPSGTTQAWSVRSVVVCALPPPDVRFIAEHHGYGIEVEDGEYVYPDMELSQQCGQDTSPFAYLTAVGGGQNGDPGEVNLEWFFDPDGPGRGGLRRNMEDGGYSGVPTSPYISLICVVKV